MQREIKFRAWLKDLKTMQVVSELNMWNLGHVFTVDEDNLHYKTSGNVNYTLMQYVGLKDKNGVEIYEGDIVIKDSYTEIAVVEYYSLCCNYTLNDTLLSLKAGMATNYFEGEVIGNIYENPELLEVK